MHSTVSEKLYDWYNKNKKLFESSKIADVGSYNINGNTNDIIKNVVGFDILEGKGVDVVIIPGKIPSEYINQFNIVTSISSFQFCPDSKLYKKQITDLLCKGGFLFLTMCSDECEKGHSTSPNKYGYSDEVRMSFNDMKLFFEEDFDVEEITYVKKNKHSDLILIATKK